MFDFNTKSFKFDSLQEIQSRMSPAHFKAFKRFVEFEYEIPIDKIPIDLLSFHADKYLKFSVT